MALVKPIKTEKLPAIKATGSGPTALMLAEKYDEDNFSKVKGWLMSEKLDGVRCYWNG